MRTALIMLLMSWSILLYWHAPQLAVAQGVTVSTPGPSGPPTASVPTLPDDPLAKPVETLSALKAAKRIGWAALAFAILTLISRLLGRATKIKTFAPLARGKNAVIVGAAGALVAATYNAFVLGGTMVAAFVAGAVALAHYLDAAPKADEADAEPVGAEPETPPV